MRGQSCTPVTRADAEAVVALAEGIAREPRRMTPTRLDGTAAAIREAEYDKHLLTAITRLITAP